MYPLLTISTSSVDWWRLEIGGGEGEGDCRVMGDGRVISSLLRYNEHRYHKPFFALHHPAIQRQSYSYIATMEDIMTITPLGSGQGEKKH
jgi:hypothetical protein